MRIIWADINLNLTQQVRRRWRLKTFLHFSDGDQFVRKSGIVWAIVVEGLIFELASSSESRL